MSNAYATADTAQDTAERMTRRVTNDIRGRVRKIFPAPELFSNSWFELSDTYQGVAAVAVMEERDLYTNPEGYATTTLLGTNVAPESQQVGKAAKSSTIWERDDVCVRLIVEEGKTNLIVRTLEEFYAATHLSPEVSSSTSVPSRLFEIAAGSLVRCTLTALESLQTLDVRALITHCSLVLDARLADGQPTPVSKDGALSLLTQSGAVIGYLAHLVVNMERLRNEDVIFEQLIDCKIFDKVVRHGELNTALLCSPSYRDIIRQIATDAERNSLSACYAYILERDFPANYVIFFSAFLNSEHHKTTPTAVFPGKPEKQKFANVMEGLTRVLMPGATVSSDLRKSTRPLTDAILRFK